jgi:hypothetical protein
MHKYRITKYNPVFRDNNGWYHEDDWIMIWQIGDTFNGRVFTTNDYLQMEDKYWETLRYLLELSDVDLMKIVHVERADNIKPFFTTNKYVDTQFVEKAIKLNRPIRISNIEIVVRLCLRGIIWCKLISKTKVNVSFGYDYYMYLETNDLLLLDNARIPEGIYIEKLMIDGKFVQI